eukprot:6202220-Pleurochrysis_carterae.AAC.1
MLLAAEVTTTRIGHPHVVANSGRMHRLGTMIRAGVRTLTPATRLVVEVEHLLLIAAGADSGLISFVLWHACHVAALAVASVACAPVLLLLEVCFA